MTQVCGVFSDYNTRLQAASALANNKILVDIAALETDPERETSRSKQAALERKKPLGPKALTSRDDSLCMGYLGVLDQKLRGSGVGAVGAVRNDYSSCFGASIKQLRSHSLVPIMALTRRIVKDDPLLLARLKPLDTAAGPELVAASTATSSSFYASALDSTVAQLRDEATLGAPAVVMLRIGAFVAWTSAQGDAVTARNSFQWAVVRLAACLAMPAVFAGDATSTPPLFASVLQTVYGETVPTTRATLDELVRSLDFLEPGKLDFAVLNTGLSAIATPVAGVPAPTFTCGTGAPVAAAAAKNKPAAAAEASMDAITGVNYDLLAKQELTFPKPTIVPNRVEELFIRFVQNHGYNFASKTWRAPDEAVRAYFAALRARDSTDDE
jgi:hypothetical protein